MATPTCYLRWLRGEHIAYESRGIVRPRPEGQSHVLVEHQGVKAENAVNDRPTAWIKHQLFESCRLRPPSAGWRNDVRRSWLRWPSENR